MVPEASILTLSTPTRSPSTFISPPKVAPPTLEASIVPETILVPGSVGIVVPELVNCTSPVWATLNPVSTFAADPVSKAGKSKTRIGCCSPSAVVGSSTSKLRTCPAWLIRTRLVPGTAVTVMLPPGASMVPVLITVPPIRDRLFSDATVKLPPLIMVPPCDPSN